MAMSSKQGLEAKADGLIDWLSAVIWQISPATLSWGHTGFDVLTSWLDWDGRNETSASASTITSTSASALT